MFRFEGRRSCLLLAVVALAVAGCSSTSSYRYATVAGPLPQVAGESLTGGSVSASSYAGRIVVLNFWNPYCSPCRQEARTLEKAWTSLRRRGVVFIGIHTWGRFYPYHLSVAREYLRGFGVTYPVLDDASRQIIRSFGLDDIPITLVADARGALRFEVLGPVKPGELELLVRLASSPPPSASSP